MPSKPGGPNKQGNQKNFLNLIDGGTKLNWGLEFEERTKSIIKRERKQKQVVVKH